MTKKQTGIIALVVLVLVWTLVGCQQKSVIDKCVEAQAIALCNKVIGGESNYQLQQSTESKCIKESIKANGGNWQLQCLKAQSGKE
jgi:hypothetical protein